MFPLENRTEFLYAMDLFQLDSDFFAFRAHPLTDHTPNNRIDTEAYQTINTTCHQCKRCSATTLWDDGHILTVISNMKVPPPECALKGKGLKVVQTTEASVVSLRSI